MCTPEKVLPAASAVTCVDADISTLPVSQRGASSGKIAVQLRVARLSR